MMKKRFLIALLIIPVFIFGYSESEIRSAIVKVYTVVKKPNYKLPWSSSIEQISGSGSVISGNRILTNAHVVANRTFIEVQRYGERHRYVAHVEAVSHQLDLAILKVDDDSFFKGIKPLELGKLPQIEQKISVYGFPMGGDTLSITSGVVSRIENQQYIHSGESFLAIQVDAAINPGNSGGPAISDGKIVGIVMEGIQKAQNISYLVPTVMVRHFLNDLKDGHLDGVPAFPVLTQSTENPALKKFYHLKDNEGGVLVDKVLKEGDTKGVLKKGDVILDIDSHPIQEDSTVAFRKNEFTNFEYYAQLHQIGDRVNLTILRDGNITKVALPLLKTANDLLLTGTYQYDKMPTYFIFGGYVFSPLTRNLAVQVARRYISLIPYVESFVTPKRKSVALLLRVLPSAISRGDYGIMYWPIERVNGKKIKSFQELYKAIKNTKGEFTILENKIGEKVIIDNIQAKKYEKMILQRYNIEYSSSKDLR